MKKPKLRLTLVDCGFWKKQKRFLIGIKECSFLRGKEGRLWRKRTRVWTTLFLKGLMKSITSLSIHPSNYPSAFSLFIVFILGSKHRHISHPVLSYCFLCGIGTAISNSIVICVINKDMCGGVRELRRYMSKGKSHFTIPSPLKQAEQEQHLTKEGQNPSMR